MIPSRKLRKPPTIHSHKFSAPVGTDFMLRVAMRAQTISTRATAQVTIIEFVIGNPKRRTTSAAFREIPCSSCSSLRASDWSGPAESVATAKARSGLTLAWQLGTALGLESPAINKTRNTADLRQLKDRCIRRGTNCAMYDREETSHCRFLQICDGLF